MRWQTRRQRRKETSLSQDKDQRFSAINSTHKRVNRKLERVNDGSKRVKEVKAQQRSEAAEQRNPERKANHPSRPQKRLNEDDGGMLSKQQRKHRAPKSSDKEEKEFANMVTKYRKRLGKQSD